MLMKDPVLEGSCQIVVSFLIRWFRYESCGKHGELGRD